MSLLELAVTAFVTLFIAMGPIENAVIFAGLSAGSSGAERLRLAGRAVLIAGLVLLLFAFFGLALLGALHISLDAFRVAGGILLLLQSVDLIFAHPTGLSSITPSEEQEARSARDLAVFPLAFPLTAGPATLTAVVLLVGHADGDVLRTSAVIGMLLACLLIAWICMVGAGLIQRVLKTTGSNVVARVSGVILAALAVQFVFDGVRGAQLFG